MHGLARHPDLGGHLDHGLTGQHGQHRPIALLDNGQLDKHRSRPQLVSTQAESLIASWRRSLRARNLAPRTVETYTDSANQLADWLAERGVTDFASVTRELGCSDGALPRRPTPETHPR